MRVSKVLSAIVAGSLVGVLQVGYAQVSVDELEKQVKQMQKQIDSLKKQKLTVTAPAAIGTSHVPMRETFTSSLGGEVITTSPFLGGQTRFDTNNLLVSVPSVNEDLRLLYFRKNGEDSLRANNIEIPDHPYIKLSGKLEGGAERVSNYDDSRRTDIDLTEAELDVFMGVHPWITSYFTFNFDNSMLPTDPVITDNSRFFMDKGFFTIGNLSKTPFYATLGQVYVPFGRFATNMITRPLVKYLGRVRNRALVLGYGDEKGVGIYAAAFTFRGNTNDNNEDANHINTYGANVDYVYDAEHKLYVDLGVSVISELAESDGMQAGTAFGTDATTENLVKHVPGADVHGIVRFGNFSVVGEYVGATRKFAASDMSFNGRGARPWATDFELGYDFPVGSYPTNVTVSYQQTDEAVALNLPQERYAVTFTTAVLRNTTQRLEFRRDKEYDLGTSGAINNGADTSHTKRYANTLVAHFGIFF